MVMVTRWYMLPTSRNYQPRKFLPVMKREKDGSLNWHLGRAKASLINALIKSCSDILGEELGTSPLYTKRLADAAAEDGYEWRRLPILYEFLYTILTWTVPAVCVPKWKDFRFGFTSCHHSLQYIRTHAWKSCSSARSHGKGGYTCASPWLLMVFSCMGG